MTITIFPARNELTATSGQTVFNYTFKIFSAADLNVYITPAGQAADDVADITTAYVVDPGTIGDAAGGFITMNVGVTLGDLVTIVSNVPDSRTTDYQVNGDFVPDTVNDDFDRTVQIAKQTVDIAGRTIAFQQAAQNVSGLNIDEPIALEFLRWKGDLSGIESVDLAATGLPSDASVITYRVTTTVEFQLDANIAAINDKADIASPIFTDQPEAPTPSPGDDSALISTTEFVQNRVANLVSADLPAATISAIGAVLKNRFVNTGGGWVFEDQETGFKIQTLVFPVNAVISVSTSVGSDTWPEAFSTFLGMSMTFNRQGGITAGVTFSTTGGGLTGTGTISGHDNGTTGSRVGNIYIIGFGF